MLISNSSPARRDLIGLRATCAATVYKGAHSFGHSRQGHGRPLLPSCQRPWNRRVSASNRRRPDAATSQAACPGGQFLVIRLNRLCQHCAAYQMVRQSCLPMFVEASSRMLERGRPEALFSLIPRSHTPRRVVEYSRLSCYIQESEAILTPSGLAVSSRPRIALRQGCDLMNHPKVPQRGDFTRKPTSPSAHLCSSVSSTAFRFRGHLNSPGVPAA